MRKWIMFSIGLFFFVGCANQNYVRTPMLNLGYDLKKEMSAPVGSVMLSRESWEKLCWEYWAGLVNGGYKTRCDEDIDRFKEELIYAGRAGSVIRIAYKEYKGNESLYLARPAFFQDLNYDLGSSDIIVFRGYRIRVLEATNERILFIIQKDK